MRLRSNWHGGDAAARGVLVHEDRRWSTFTVHGSNKILVHLKHEDAAGRHETVLVIVGFTLVVTVSVSMAVSMVAAAQEAGARDIHCKIDTGNRDWSCAYAGMSLPSLPLLMRAAIKKATPRRARRLQLPHPMRQ